MSSSSLSFTCSRCGKPLLVPSSMAGRTVSCTQCGAPQLVAPPAAVAMPPHLMPSPSQSAVKTPASIAPLPPHLATSEQAKAPNGPLPPHLLDKTERAAPQPPVRKPPPIVVHAETDEEGEDEEDDDVEDEAPPRAVPAWIMGCLILLGALLVGTGGVAMVVLFSFAAKQISLDRSVDRRTADAKDSVLIEILPGEAKNSWHDASKVSIAFEGVSVRIDWVEFGTVRYKTVGGRVEESPDDDFLKVTLNVKNRVKEQITYKSWYSFQFRDEEGTYGAQLEDEDGVQFETVQVPGAERVEMHGPAETVLGVKEETADTIVFQLPPEYERMPRRGLRLSLPAAAVGGRGRGAFLFTIPPEMIGGE